MEAHRPRRKELPVLIAPLWNWNGGEPPTTEGTPARSNRTFMELKYGSKLQAASDDLSSNRTFMELKLRYQRKQQDWTLF